MTVKPDFSMKDKLERLVKASKKILGLAEQENGEKGATVERGSSESSSQARSSEVRERY